MTETIINEEEREALTMEWKDVPAVGVKPKDKKLLDKLTSTFMLTSFGRPGVLFDPSRNILRRDDFGKLERNQANHLYLANIATELLNKNHTLLQMGQLFTLIQDLDVTLLSGTSPYIDKYDGFQKWNHPDFKKVRTATKQYFKRILKNPDEKSKAYRGFTQASETTIDSVISITKRVAGIRE